MSLQYLRFVCPTSNKDFRPVALTCIVVKCFEKLMINKLKDDVAPCLDPLQFAYKKGRSTADAVTCVSHSILKHLETPNTYARVLFADFSAAFDTVKPELLARKLFELKVNPGLIKWFYSLITNRTQQVKLNGVLSTAKTNNMGVPQGAVSSPVLFTLYTNDCKSSNPQNRIIKFSDDTIILSLLTVSDLPSVYYNEVNVFKDWCKNHHLRLNSDKTKEMIFDPKMVGSHDPVIIDGKQIDQVNSFKYLGMYIDNNFKWSDHVDHLCLKLAQRLYFLRRLRLFGVSVKIMTAFYNAVLESLVRYGMAVWFGALTVKDKTRIQKLINVAMKTIGCKNIPLLQKIFESTVLTLAKKITSDPEHVLHREYEVLPSGRRFRALRYKSNRYKFSFLPTSVAFLNKQT